MPRSSGETKTRTFAVDNASAANPFDFVHVLEDPIKQVTEIELVSMAMELPNMYAWLRFDFDNLETQEVPVVANRDYTSPLAIDDTNRYVFKFNHPAMPTLTRMRIRLYKPDGITLYDAAGFSERLSMVLRVRYAPFLGSDGSYLADGNFVEVQRDYLVVDNRFRRSGDPAYDFHFPNMTDAEITLDENHKLQNPFEQRLLKFQNITRISLKEAILSRDIAPADTSYVLAKVRGESFPLFFRYDSHGLYFRYELMKTPEYVAMEFNPPLFNLKNGFPVQICDPDTGEPFPSGTDPNIESVCILVFEVEHVPRAEVIPGSPLRMLRKNVLIDNIGAADRADFTWPVEGLLRNVASVTLKQATLPSSVTNDNGTLSWKHIAEIELVNLGITWTLLYGRWQVASEPNAMRLDDSSEDKALFKKGLRPPRTFDGIHVRLWTVEADGKRAALVHGETDRTVLLLECAYTPLI
jgi:hypothetical protein